ncbi:MAG: biotin transporter BioY [Dehalococcoidia bacterium]
MVGKVALALGMAAVTGLLAQLQVALPFAQAPTTGQLFAALLAGVLLGRWYGGLSQVLYAAIGAAGVDWFVGSSVGLSYLTGVTGGYMVGFVVAAFVIGWLTEEHIGARRFPPLLGLMLVGVGIIYLFGFVAVWLAIVPTGSLSQASILVDLVKAAVAAAIAYALLPKTAFSDKVGPTAVARRRGFSLPSLRRGSKRLTRVGRPVRVREVRGEARPAPEVAPVAEAAAEEPKAEAPVEAPPAEEAAAEEPKAEAPVEASPAAEEEGTGREPTEEERSALYSGEVELALAPPLDAAVMSRLHGLLLSNPELKILRTVGSWARGTTITVFLDRPLPLVGVLTEIPEIRLASRQKAGGRGGVLSGSIAITIDSRLATGESSAGEE